MFAFGVISIELWPTQMPVWAFVLALAISLVYVIPIGMIQAITNQQIGLNVITELIIGYDSLHIQMLMLRLICKLRYALPGRPIAMMMFKTWGFIVNIWLMSFNLLIDLDCLLRRLCIKLCNSQAISKWVII